MNLETINKWLDEEYGCSYTKLEELHDWLVEENMKLKDKNQQLKKQKHDVVEYCKKAIESLNWKKRDIMQILTPENGYLKADIEIEINKYKDLLRMLGEIDE